MKLLSVIGLGILLAIKPAYAFNSLTHQEIIKSALDHLETHARLSTATDSWLGLESAEKKELIRKVLIRSTVDEDYRANIWLDATFHSPFTGAKGQVANIFTTFSHHLNVSVPGVFWQYDGYAYRNTDGKGNDKYLGLPSVTVKGELSGALGGHSPHGFLPENDLGAYRTGFLGTSADWQKMFFGDNKASEAVFPPANVPAQIAYDRILASPVAKASRIQKWDESLPLASGVFSNDDLGRKFWRAEIAGVPSGFDLLGTVLHMTEDVSVPHHTQGIGSYCHAELEQLGDDLSCGHPVEQKTFDDGTFDDLSWDHCQNLYDPAMVQQFRENSEILNSRSPMTIGDRLIAIAKETARWKWGKGPKSDDEILTRFPDGTELLGEDCKTLMDQNLVKLQLKRQYNFAVAATTLVFELVAKEYEKIH